MILQGLGDKIAEVPDAHPPVVPPPVAQGLPTVPLAPTLLRMASYNPSHDMGGQYNITSNQDPVRDLNNYLMGHPSGNLARFLSWALDQSGPDHQKTHNATAKCESVFQPDLEPCAESRSRWQGDWLREGSFHRPCQEGGCYQSSKDLTF